MSQYPPPQQPPFAPPPPPGAPYGQQGYSVPGPRKGNGAAIASLVCGLVFCIPFLTGLLALILGVVGIKKSNDPRVGSGKGLAIAGIILGVLSIGGWGLFGGAIFALVKGTEAQRIVAKQFLTDLSAGKIDAAKAQTDGSMSTEELQALSDKMKGWGQLTDTTIIGVSAEPGKTQVGGSATFGTTPKGFEAVILKQPDGSYKVSSLTFK